MTTLPLIFLIGYRGTGKSATARALAEHLGAGFIRGQYSFGVHVQHLSNGGITEPNPGINFVMLRLQYHLD